MILVKVLGEEIAPLRLDADLVHDLDANSMDMAEIADLAEERVGITFCTDDQKTMTTVADVLAYKEVRLATTS